VEAARVTPRKYGGRSAAERKAERYATLVSAAQEIWQEQGWAAVTMRGVCARAGLTDRYFYESFADRDALLATVWDQARDDTLVMLLGAITSAPQEYPLLQLKSAIHAVVHHIADEPARAQILFGDHAGSAVLEQRRRDTVQLTSDLMIDLAKPFLRDPTNTTSLRMTVVLGIGGFIELMLAWRLGLVQVDPDEIIDHLAGVGEALAAQFLREDPSAGVE
jgi:AcrR family transcriptional regulator